jgi:hypothetical protein
MTPTGLGVEIMVSNGLAPLVLVPASTQPYRPATCITRVIDSSLLSGRTRPPCKASSTPFRPCSGLGLDGQVDMPTSHFVNVLV